MDGGRVNDSGKRLPFTSVLVGALALGCSAAPASSAAATEAPSPAVTVAPERRDAAPVPRREAEPPELVELAAPTDEPDDCAAQGPKDGLFDTSSSRYRRIEIRRGKQVIEERAFLRNSDVVVSLHLGGCAHYAAHYVVTYSDVRGASARAYHLDRALSILESLPYKTDGGVYVDDLARLIRGLFSRPKELEECSFAHGGMTQISCDVDTEPGARVRVALTYDIVL